MTTSRTALKSKKAALNDVISSAKLVYFRDRLKDTLYSAMLEAFSDAVETGMTKKDLAQRVQKKPEQITRILSAPGNLTLDTISDILLGLDSEINVEVKKFVEYERHNQTQPSWLEIDYTFNKLKHEKNNNDKKITISFHSDSNIDGDAEKIFNTPLNIKIHTKE